MRLWDKEIMAIEKPIIEEYLAKSGNNKYRTCLELGINRGTFDVLIDRYDIKVGKLSIIKDDFYVEGCEMVRLSKHKIKEMLEKYINKHEGNQTATAIDLGITRKTLKTKIDYYGIKVEKLNFTMKATNKPTGNNGIMGLWHKEIMKIEKPVLEEFLKKHNDNVSRASADLGISECTLWRRIEAYDIKVVRCEESSRKAVLKGNNFRDRTKPMIRAMLNRYYIKNNYIQRDTAKELGINPNTVRKKLEYYKIYKPEW